MTIVIIIHFVKKNGTVQYHATLAITGTMSGTSPEKLYQELGFSSLFRRR